MSKPALVFDVDDTALGTYGYEVAHDFAYDATSWNAAAAAEFPAIAPTLALARHAVAKGVAVFFVTGRREPQTALTVKNLTDAGYPFVHAYLRPVDDRAPSVAPFKSSARAAIEAAGYTVLENDRRPMERPRQVVTPSARSNSRTRCTRCRSGLSGRRRRPRFVRARY